jgi:hypothetical protein
MGEPDRTVGLDHRAHERYWGAETFVIGEAGQPGDDVAGAFVTAARGHYLEQ